MSALPQQLERVVIALCDDVGSQVAQAVKNAIVERNYRSLVTMTVDPSAYTCARSYLEDVSCVEFLRKYTGFAIPGIDKAQVAIDNFWVAEEACCKTNARLSRFVNAQGPFEDAGDLRLLESLEWMRSWIRDVLGALPASLEGRFGPGATYHDVGRLTTVPDKITSRPTSTSEARCLLPLWSPTAWCRALVSSNQSQSDPEIVRGNRFTTVPKDARKDRGIAIEPSLNVFYQLAVGKAIRSRLRERTGVDLQSGQDSHRRMAREASRTGLHATIDLSNASDTVSYNLVKILLPEGWFNLVDTLRSPYTLVRGQWVRLHKFSSMGNGYTFELETLVFLASVAYACHLHGESLNRGSNASVYGDDIILPVKASGTLISLLQWLGFSPNKEKTFTTGKFRESCGGDYFDGKAVRPYYQKEIPDEPAKWIRMANGIRRLGHQDPFSDFRWSTPWRAWLRALDAIPTDIRRLRGPEDLGDLVIHDDREFWQSHRRTRGGTAFLRTWAPVIPKLSLHHWKPDVVLAAALYGIPSDGVASRGVVSGYRKRWTAYPL